MSLEDLELPRTYADGKVLYAANLTSVLLAMEEAWATLNLNLTQLRKDCFLSTYDYTNNGVNAVSSSLQSQINLLASGGTPITGTSSDTFTVNTDGSGATLSTASLTATRTFLFPDIAGTFVVTAGAQTIAGVKTFSDDIYLAATKKLYLDGGGDTYITESSANVMRFFCNGTNYLQISGATNPEVSVPNGNFSIAATNILYLDGGGDTYISEQSANVIILSTGGVLIGISSTIFDLRSRDLWVNATQKIYLDGGGDTYISESSPNVMVLVAGTAAALTLTSTTVTVGSNEDLVVAATKKLYLDGGGDTYIQENAANDLRIFVGGSNKISINTSFIELLNNDVLIQATKKLYLDSGGDTYIDEVSANVMRFTSGGSEFMRGTTSVVQIAAGYDLNIAGGSTYRWTSNGDIVARQGIYGWASSVGADTVVLDISGSNAGAGAMYGITFTTTLGTLDSPFNFASAYYTTTALGAYYGRLAVGTAAGIKYIPLYNA